MSRLFSGELFGVGLAFDVAEQEINLIADLLGGPRRVPVPQGPRVSLKIHGVDKLVRDLGGARSDFGKDLRKALQEAAEPVRRDAEVRASSGIRNIGLPWSGMRVGGLRGGVYLAPRSRATRSAARRRPNLATLLMGVSMEPAVESHASFLVDRVEGAIDQTMKRHGL